METDILVAVDGPLFQSYFIMTSSPSASPVKLSDCIEDLLHSTLTFSTCLPTVNLSLSKPYISRLLQIDYPDPLYKRLARNLDRCIASRCFSWEFGPIDSVLGDSVLKSNEKNWSDIIAEKGSEILTVLERVDFEFHVQEPYFSLLRDGVKTVEGRCAVGDYIRIKPGDLLLINKFLLLEVQNVNRYASFFEMLKSEDLSNVLPGITTIEEGVQVYRKFYTKEKEMSNGVVAISVSRPAPQLYDLLADLLSELSHDGIGALLGMVPTVGSVADALPPPRSSLVASSMELHSPSVKGKFLTVAARALAKHVHRSGERWWSHLSGNDFNKNKIASEVINSILNDCCWMNVHFLQPHGCVFEMRVREGYGARWSADGAKNHIQRKATPGGGNIKDEGVLSKSACRTIMFITLLFRVTYLSQLRYHIILGGTAHAWRLSTYIFVEVVALIPLLAFFSLGNYLVIRIVEE